MLDKLLRYGTVARHLGPAPSGTILEVGAGPQGLGACLPYPFVGVDPWYPEPPVTTQKAVRASGDALPFADATFDHVLCIEVLEHVPPENRPRVVAELCRVARRQVIITHPFGRAARLADRVLGVFYAALRPFKKNRPWWLVEHGRYPFPDPAHYLPTLPSKVVHVSAHGQENAFCFVLLTFFGNLRWVARLVRRIHTRFPHALLRFMRGFNFPPYYGRVVVLKINEGGALRPESS